MRKARDVSGYPVPGGLANNVNGGSWRHWWVSSREVTWSDVSFTLYCSMRDELWVLIDKTRRRDAVIHVDLVNRLNVYSKVEKFPFFYLTLRGIFRNSVFFKLNLVINSWKIFSLRPLEHLSLLISFSPMFLTHTHTTTHVHIHTHRHTCVALRSTYKLVQL